MVDKAVLAKKLHQYGVVDVDRVFAVASHDLDDLLRFRQRLTARAPD